MSNFSHFNIVAFPEDPTLREIFYRAAEILTPKATGYLLAAGETLPHMTLCQFRHSNAETVALLAGQFTVQEVPLRLTGRYIDQCRGEDEGMFWTGYVVKPEPRILDLHMSIVRALQAEHSEILGKTGGAYFPHFTLAQTNQRPGYDGDAYYDQQLIGPDIRCRIRLGRSDPLGQLLGFADGPL